MQNSFSLFIFSTDTDFIKSATEAGADGFIVDWEHIGKENRQNGVDTQINYDTAEDLCNMRRSTPARIICRINQFGVHTESEINLAIACGADEILLPMVRNLSDVKTVCSIIQDRCDFGILIETIEAVNMAAAFNDINLSRIYMGLNDLWIDRKTPTLFTAIKDGTVEEVRSKINHPFGFAGLTLPEKGSPIPCHLLMSEMSRLDCSFSFLRRSFFRDIKGKDLKVEIPRIRETILNKKNRTRQETANDHKTLIELINE